MEIDNIQFSKLSEEALKTTPKYNPFCKIDAISHIGNDTVGYFPVLPSSCTPSEKRYEGTFEDKLCPMYSQLYQYVFSNDKEKIETMSSAIQSEIQSRWGNGKNGRWRSAVCGKRCEFSARSVLTPNPHLEIHQVGLPLCWKSKLTLVEHWTNFNKKYKVAYYIDAEGKRYHPKYKKWDASLKVERELENGGLVIVNRQPTLRESNIVSMNLVWIDTLTVQLNPSVFSLFDADCDGDEVNIHIPQVEQCHLERLHVLDTIKRNQYQLKLIQDAAVGMCLKYDVKNKREVNVSSFDMKHLYLTGTRHAYTSGFSIGFDFNEIDFMIDSGAKGKPVHKGKMRQMLDGVYDDSTHWEQCKQARIALISTSLKTAETGYISRRLSYHFDDVKLNPESHLLTDLNLWVIRYPPLEIPASISHVKGITNFGLHLNSIIMPPLTQGMLDSFHAASAGETVNDNTSVINSILNCSHPELKHCFKISGIIAARRWIFNALKEFLPNINEYYIQSIVDFLCITGRPLGIQTNHLRQRYELYSRFDDSWKVPILKLAKFQAPYKIIQYACENNMRDTLDSYHSFECFFEQ